MPQAGTQNADDAPYSSAVLVYNFTKRERRAAPPYKTRMSLFTHSCPPNVTFGNNFSQFLN